MVLFSDPEEAQRALLEGEVRPGPGCAAFPRTHTAEATSNESWTMPGPAAPPSGWLPQPGTVPTTAIRSGATTATTALPMSSGMPTSACPRPAGPRRRRRAPLIRVHRVWAVPASASSSPTVAPACWTWRGPTAPGPGCARLGRVRRGREHRSPRATERWANAARSRRRCGPDTRSTRLDAGRSVGVWERPYRMVQARPSGIPPVMPC